MTQEGQHSVGVRQWARLQENKIILEVDFFEKRWKEGDGGQRMDAVSSVLDRRFAALLRTP